MMKKVGIILTGALILLLAGIVILATVDFNRLGKENVFTQIEAPVEIDEMTLDSGEIVYTYWYEETAFEENGSPLDVRYSATRELREGAYLMLYVDDDGHVTSFDEVELEDIPQDARGWES
ncbi:YxeA family protein [Paenalkalicoccus suaedae]|uniref:YxeA family protein n=1 Tax=Paenalkalicoccus suaedae TaxID=2592382 RepID=A0A859FJN1_9BACI|nr:YxeA family protein [Paenalkalicoccus suaedae]QKS73013.1 YxeA family protein [Paenalkalicoccus suaedae]